jgi:hypothetical protein
MVFRFGLWIWSLVLSQFNFWMSCTIDTSSVTNCTTLEAFRLLLYNPMLVLRWQEGQLLDREEIFLTQTVVEIYFEKLANLWQLILLMLFGWIENFSKTFWSRMSSKKNIFFSLSKQELVKKFYKYLIWQHYAVYCNEWKTDVKNGYHAQPIANCRHPLQLG